MQIPAQFIRRPIATTLLMACIMGFGILAYRRLPVSDLPNVDFPTIEVSASLPGASPDTMAAAVATPLERQFSTIAGLQSMTSSSTLGSTTITLQFALSRNIDAAAEDVASEISAAAGLLPPEMPTPPTYRKENPAAAPVLYLALTGSQLPIYRVDEFAETLMGERISTVSGVAEVTVFGSQKYAVRIQVNPDALATRGLTLEDVRQAVSSVNVNEPTGTLWGAHQSFTVTASGQLQDAAEFRPVIVAYRNGSPVRLDQIGRVLDSVEDNKTAAWFNDERSVILAIQRQPGTNTIDVVDAIRKLLPTFYAQLPAGMHINVVYDRSTSIRASIEDVKLTLLITVALVILVIFLFLRNLSGTLIPGMAIPISILGTFAVMYLLGYTLDNFSLLALTLSVGFVVDDAIVMLENIVRHREMGQLRLEGAIKGADEIGFTIVSMTVSLAAVFIPVLFMGGIIGRLLREFAVTISLAILISGFVSLSLTPMLSSRFLVLGTAKRHSYLYLLFERGFERMLHAYERGLRFVLRHRFATLLFAIGLVAATGYMFYLVPKGFLPSEDTGQLFATTEAAQGISFQGMVELQREAANVIQADPNVATVSSFIGGGAINQGRLFMRLKPLSERKLSADEIIQELRPKLAGIPGLRVYLQNPPSIQVGGRLGAGLYQYTLTDGNLTELLDWAPIVEQKLRDSSVTQDVSTDLFVSNPQITVDIDRDKALALGVTPEAIEETLDDAYGDRQVSTIYTQSDEYEVILEVLPEAQSSPSALSLLYVRSSGGQLIPLDAVAKFTRTVGPLAVNHTGQLPSVTISFNLKPGVSLGQAVDQIQSLVKSLRMPITITGSFQGTAQAFQTSVRSLWILLVIALLVIYTVLGVLYESFVHPLTILSGLPSAGFGALLILYISHVDLSLYAFVGLIMLIGIVKKNAIMMIDFALVAEREDHLAPQEAIYRGCVIRFRPIMMTAMAALLGSVPIALGVGAGSESRRPLGLVVVGGLLFSQFVTLFLTPTIYVYLDLLERRIGRIFGLSPRRGAESGTDEHGGLTEEGPENHHLTHVSS